MSPPRPGCALPRPHRVGDLRIGDVALFAAASAGHRKEAFDACELLVEEIKRGVPIWKRQHYADGVSEWVGPALTGLHPAPLSR